MTTPNGPDSLVVAVPFAATAVPLQIVGKDCVLAGWALIENTGAAAAQVDLIDGNGANGSLLAPVSLQAGQSTREWFGPWGPAIQSALFLQVNAGTVRGVLYVVLP